MDNKLKLLISLNHKYKISLKTEKEQLEAVNNGYYLSSRYIYNISDRVANTQ